MNSIPLDMAEDERIGEIENVSYKTKHIEWRIPDFFANSENEITLFSPTFSTEDSTYCLRLQRSDEVEVDIYCEKPRACSLGYYFGLKNYDGSVEDLVFGMLKESDFYCDWEILIESRNLLQRKTELLPSETLTVTCTLKELTAVSYFAEQTVFDKPKSLKLTNLAKLSKNFRDLFADQETCDVTLKVKDKEYKAHKCVLMARSAVFAANFKHDTLERQTGVITIPDCDPNSFQEFLEYLYCGQLEELPFQSALNLYYTSDKYDVAEIKTFCVECMMQGITVETMCEIVVLANKYDESELFSAVQEFFNQNVCEILISPEWECLLKKDYRLANKLMIDMSKVKLKM